jgi:iron complex transport system substrate-binding protein
MMHPRFLVVLSVLLALIALCTVGVASSSGGVTQWNSVTEDASDSLPVEIQMDEPREVEFRVSSDSPYEWTWTVNDDELEEESEGESSDFVFVFDEYGGYTVCALGAEGNEPAASACWNVTVSLVIGAENDVQDLEGLEDYTLRFSQRPERIISMAPSCTEILFAVGAGDRVVSVTDYCDYPPEALELETIGGYSTPSLEKIVAFEPDLIVGAHGNPNDVVYRLIELGYPVYGQNPEDIDEILTQIKIMGAITGCADDSASLAQDLSERLEPIKEATESLEEAQRPRVFYNIGDFFTAGDGTFINEVIRLAGGTNIAADTSGYYTMNLEELIDKNPHVIICDSGMGTMEAAKEGIMKDTRLQIVDAVNNSWVYVIDGDIIDRPGPRIIDAVEIVYDDYSDFFAAAEADEGDNGEDPGSGGGSSAKVTPPPTATPTVTKASRNIPFLQAGVEVAMIFEDMDVALIALEAADGNVSDLNVAVERVEKSAEIPDPSGIAYAYLDIEIDHEETVDLDGRIECKVLKSWIADNAIDETTIRLYRYNDDGGWQALATSKSREETDFVYFEAETSQFSLFVITGEKAVTVTSVSAPLVALDQIAAVGVGEPLAVTGTSNRKDGFAIVVTVTGPVELQPQTVALANGAFEATFDTSTAAAAGGIYTVTADDGEGHLDEATVTIGAASAASPPESTAPTTSEVPGFEAIVAVVAVLTVRRLRRRNERF